MTIEQMWIITRTLQREYEYEDEYIAFTLSGYLMSSTRARLIEKFVEWINEELRPEYHYTWRQLKRRGYRCVRAEVCWQELPKEKP